MSNDAVIRQAHVLHCPVCRREVFYVIAQVNGPGSYQPCGHPIGKAVK